MKSNEFRDFLKGNKQEQLDEGIKETLSVMLINHMAKKMKHEEALKIVVDAIDKEMEKGKEKEVKQIVGAIKNAKLKKAAMDYLKNQHMAD